MSRMLDTTNLPGGLKDIAISHNSNVILQELTDSFRYNGNLLQRTAWCCLRCKQVNAGYAKTCGRCEDL